MLKVWGRRSSANVQKVMWLVGELQLAHEHIPAGGPYGVTNEPKFRAMNPNGLVPVIEDDGLVMWESNAILRYLAARYGKDTFWPDRSARRARPSTNGTDWAGTTFQPNIIGLFGSYWRTPEDQRNPNAIRNLLQRTERQSAPARRRARQAPLCCGRHVHARRHRIGRSPLSLLHDGHAVPVASQCRGLVQAPSKSARPIASMSWFHTTSCADG